MTETDHAIHGDQPTASLLQHNEELRAALGHAVRLLAHTAGRESADNPERSERLMTTVGHMADLLNRTAPATDIREVIQAGDSHPACICPEHTLTPAQALHWAAECPGRHP